LIESKNFFMGNFAINAAFCLDCANMAAFDGSGSANPAIYWAPESGCTLATWQSAYSALVEGEYTKCKQLAKP
jgi:hypothetical protein